MSDVKEEISQNVDSLIANYVDNEIVSILKNDRNTEQQTLKDLYFLLDKEPIKRASWIIASIAAYDTLTSRHPESTLGPDVTDTVKLLYCVKIGYVEKD